MAVRKVKDDAQESQFVITNGDLNALKKVTDQYNLKDSSDVITYALGILSQSNGRPVEIEREDGTKLKLLPSDEIRKSEE